jgi:hypothetical protein
LLAALRPEVRGRAAGEADDARIKTESLEFDSPQGYGKARGYLSPPRSQGTLPLVLVVHENRGLNPHIEDIARRLALEDFIAFAPDALFPLGGYPATRTRHAPSSRSSTRPDEEDFVAAAGVLGKVEGGNGRLGVVALLLRRRHGELSTRRAAGASRRGAFYGAAAPLDQVANIIGRAPARVRREGRARQRHVADYGPSSRNTRSSTRRSPTRYRARLQQRHHAALRRGGGEAGLGTDARLLQPHVAGTA